MVSTRLLNVSFFSNEELADMPMSTRLLFQGLWFLADREGRLEDRPRRIKAEIFPYDDVKVNEGLEALAQAGFIQRYEAEGKRFIWVVNFVKHQHPHPHEARSVLPPPPNDLHCNDMQLHDTESNVIPGTFTITSDITNTITDGGGGSNTTARPRARDNHHQPPVKNSPESQREKILSGLSADLKAKFTPEQLHEHYEHALEWCRDGPDRSMGIRFFSRWLQRELDQGHAIPANLSKIDQLKRELEMKPDEKGLINGKTLYRIRQQIEEERALEEIHAQEAYERELRAANGRAMRSGTEASLVLSQSSHTDPAG